MFRFITLAEALEAIQKINEGEGIPIVGGVTQTYCEPFEDEETGEWLIYEDEISSKYLSND